ncbi:MAG: CPBP family intramembrane metalloprotease [Elusimicrobia bacterium]|nr:CPBP family intramembrane metalloprotease [Elusimicrobiota bacterium]
MNRYPETSLEKELWPGESQEPFPLKSGEEIAQDLGRRRMGIRTQLSRQKDGSYRATLDSAQPMNQEFLKVIQAMRSAGIDPGPQKIVISMGKEGWFEWSQDGVLFIHEGAIKTLAQKQSPELTTADVLTQILLRYALGPASPKSTRLTPQQMMAGGLWPGSPVRQAEALRVAREHIRNIRKRNWTSGISKFLLAGTLAYGILLIYMIKYSINGGLIPLLATPNLLTWTLLALPLAWPAMRWILKKIQGSMKTFQNKDIAPGMEKVSPVMRKFIQKAAGVKTDPEEISDSRSEKRASLRTMAVFSVMAFLEEYFFRYLLFHGLGSWLAAQFGLSAFVALPAAALFSAFLFALFHFPNWSGLTFKEAIGLMLYYGMGGLFLTAIYWTGGIWVATFIHMYFNTHDLNEARKQAQAARQEKKIELAPFPPPELSPLKPKMVIATDSLQKRLGLLVEDISSRLTDPERRHLLENLVSDFESSDAARSLKHELKKRTNFGTKDFNRVLHDFTAELPPQMIPGVLGNLMARLEPNIWDHLGKSLKANLPTEMEAHRLNLERDLGALLRVPISVRVFQAEVMMNVDPDWGWPVVRVGAKGDVELWLAERLFYATQNQGLHPEVWPQELARFTAEALKTPEAPLASLEPGNFERLGKLIKVTEAQMEKGKSWFKKIFSYTFWAALTLLVGVQALPLIKLLLFHPSAFPAGLVAKWGLFASNFAIPGLLIGFLAALALDWGTKIWINKLIPQVDHREAYKLQWKTLNLGRGFFSGSFRVANVLHYIHLPRRIFTFILPLALILGGLNLSANPVFAGILIGGAVGNMGEVLIKKGATDWIPVGIGIANAADFAIAAGVVGPWIIAAPQIPLALVGGFALRFIVTRLIRHFRSRPPPPTSLPTGRQATPKSPIDLLSEGERVYSAEPPHYAVENKTLEDLDVLQPYHGLYRLLNKTHTSFGAQRLDWLVRHPFLDLKEIRRRQEAVQEILKDKELRQTVEDSFKNLGDNARVPMWDHFFNGNKMDIAIFMIHNIMNPIFLLGAFTAVPHIDSLGKVFIVLLKYFGMYYFIFILLYQALVQHRQIFLRYKAAFRLARELSKPLSESRSAALREIGGVFNAVNRKDDPESLAGVAKRFSRLRSIAVVILPDFLYAHSAKTLWWLYRGYRRNKDRIARLLGALSELDVYFSMAQFALEQKQGYVFPILREAGKPYIKIDSGNHPLLALRGKSVPNSAELSISPDKINFLVATGSNMGGKSTFLKMVALLTLLAQMGAPVPAKSMELTPLQVVTSIDIRDSLADGKSLYDAETDRILHIIRQAENSKNLLVVMDEILQGTNPEERTAAEEAIVRYLARTDNLFLLATHNLNIAQLAEKEPSLKNFHVEENLENGEMKFSYKIKAGPANSRNGLLTLEMKGFPQDILQEARTRLDKK